MRFFILFFGWVIFFGWDLAANRGGVTMGLGMRAVHLAYRLGIM